MGLFQKTTGISSSNVVIATGLTGRKTNLLSISIINTGGTATVLDIKDGTSTIIHSFEVPAYGAAFYEWGETNDIGRLLTIANDCNAAARAAATMETVVEFGRV